MQGRVISISLGQYHGCWCPGSLRRQDISSHDIDYEEYVGPGLTWGRILSTCVISMWSNDMKCKYMCMIPLKNLAHKGSISIITIVVSHWHCVHFFYIFWDIQSYNNCIYTLRPEQNGRHFADNIFKPISFSILVKKKGSGRINTLLWKIYKLVR